MQLRRAPCACCTFLPLPVHQKTSWFLPLYIQWMDVFTFCSCGMQSCRAPCALPAFLPLPVHQKTSWFLPHSINNVGWMVLLSVLAGCSCAALHAHCLHSCRYQFIEKIHDLFLFSAMHMFVLLGFLCETGGNPFILKLQRLCCNQLVNDSQWMSTSDSYCARTISVQDLHFFPAFLSLLLAYILHQHPSKV